MSTPTPTARQTPVGIPLDDGLSTKITFAADPDVSFWERAVKPFGVDGGEKINTSDMFKTVWNTFSLRKLKTATDGSAVAKYDPGVLTQIVALINVETSVTWTFPDGSTWTIWGGLTKFEPQENTEGAVPLANITVSATNQDPTTGTEEGPVLVNVPGT